MPPGIDVGGRGIGDGHPCFVIAEAGVNHDGSIDDAVTLVDKAASAGADAIKFQTFTAARLAAPSALKAAYQTQATDREETQAQMLRALELSHEAHVALAERARDHGLVFLSTPFDEDAARLLISLGVPAIKIGSGDVTNVDLLAFVASLGKPVILSTGMSSMHEVAEAVSVLDAGGNVERILLHCVSSYPTAPADVNLRAMSSLRTRFECPVGFSDHTLGSAVALAAVALGAAVIEKHLTLSKERSGPDHRASFEPAEFAALVRDIRDVERSMGDGVKRPAASEADVLIAARRSLVASRAIAAGEVVSDDMLSVMRPATGLPPSARRSIVGRRVTRPIAAGSPLVEGDFA